MTRWDAAIVAIVVTAGLVLVGAAGVAQASEVSSFTVSSASGEVQYPLDRSCRISIDGALGEVVIEVRDGVAWVVSSTCPHQRCVHAAGVSSAGGSIVCVPNGVSVVADGVADSGGFDDVVR